MLPHQTRNIRSLAVQELGKPGFFTYAEGPIGEGALRLDLLYSGLSAGTELTFLKGSNPALHSRWDDQMGRFFPEEPSARYPINVLGYMEVARVIEARVPDFAVGDILAANFGHKSGHTAHPAQDLLLKLPPEMDPILGIFIAQMGPIAANGILHADVSRFGSAVPSLGAGVEGQPVVIWGGGTVGLFCALFARHAGASQVVIAEPSVFRQDLATKLGFQAVDEEAALGIASMWQDKAAGRGAEFVFQTRPHADSLHRALQALRPQGTVIDLAFYQGGMEGLRLGEEFHHNGLSLLCAQINRVPRAVAANWNQRRLAQETLRLLQREGAAIKAHMITHIVPFDEAPTFLHHLITTRPEFLQIVFEAT